MDQPFAQPIAVNSGGRFGIGRLGRKWSLIAFGFTVGGMVLRPPVVLTIAGFDPSSGAGITADVKTIAAHDCYGVCCITALTVQSTQGVRRIEGVNPAVIDDTLQELASDLEIEAVHIGMLGNEPVVKTVAGFLERSRLPHIVLDPILNSSSGTDLLDAAGTGLMIRKLIPLAEVVTPNLDEASALTGLPVTNLDQMRAAAAGLHSMGASNVVVTGGHLEKATDLLSFATSRGREQEVFKANRQRSNATHGTGCAFATALACHLAHGRGLPESVLLSKAYVGAAIANAHPLGRGIGPMHHLYRVNLQRRRSAVVIEDEQARSR
jgi:hydroxymethylpyrimidine/phosphomethylpyrimidine kinase